MSWFSKALVLCGEMIQPGAGMLHISAEVSFTPSSTVTYSMFPFIWRPVRHSAGALGPEWFASGHIDARFRGSIHHFHLLLHFLTSSNSHSLPGITSLTHSNAEWQNVNTVMHHIKQSVQELILHLLEARYCFSFVGCVRIRVSHSSDLKMILRHVEGEDTVSCVM